MDYRFIVRCWQDQAGDANALATVYVNDTEVLSNQEITASSADSPEYFTFEATGLPALADADDVQTCVIKVVLDNEYYVDSDNDRNIWINAIRIIDKADGTIYGYKAEPDSEWVNIPDVNDPQYYTAIIPTAVSGDQIGTFWADRTEDTFYNIPVWGGSSEGTSITIPLVTNRPLSHYGS